MASIGEGAARGIESGIRIGQSFIDQRQREEDRKAQQALQAQQAAQQQEDRAFQRERMGIQDARLAAQDRRQALADERQQNIDAEQALGQEFADLQNEGKGLLEQYGDFGKVPKDVGDSYAMRVAGTRARLTEARAKRYAPLVEQERQKAGQLWSRIQTGEVSLDQVPDADLVKSLTALTRRDVSDLMPIMGETNAAGLSPIQQAGRDFATGAETGNDEMMINAANMLFKPELMTGVGGPGRDGSEIVSKKIIKLIPHPNDPTHFTPLLEVKVRREDGKVGTYQAPVTENRSSDPNDNIKTLSIQDGLERVGQLTTLAEALNQRGILAKLANGINEAGDEPKNFLEAFYATGGQKPAPKKVDVGHFEDFGGYKVHYLPDGREVVIRKTATPTSGGGDHTETTARERQIARAEKAGDITPEEARAARRDLAMGIKPKGEPKPLTEGQSKANVFGSRMAEANAVLGELADQGVTQGGIINRLGKAVAGEAGDTLTNWTQSDLQQQVTQAKRDFINAVLRRESGASISNPEFANADKQYFVQPGDSPDVIERKKRNRQLAIDTMLAEVPADQRTPVPSLTGRTMGAERERAAAAPAAPAAPGTANPQQPGINLGPSQVPARRPAQPKSKAEYDALPRGATYIDPQGQTRTKG